MSKSLDVSKWPPYRTNKYVRAVRIAAMGNNDNGSVRIFPDGDMAPFDVPDHWRVKHTPMIGGYVIVYADGYMSWSPAGAFENSATRLDNGVPERSRVTLPDNFPRSAADHRQGEAE